MIYPNNLIFFFLAILLQYWMALNSFSCTHILVSELLCQLYHTSSIQLIIKVLLCGFAYLYLGILGILHLSVYGTSGKYAIFKLFQNWQKGKKQIPANFAITWPHGAVLIYIDSAYRFDYLNRFHNGGFRNFIALYIRTNSYLHLCSLLFPKRPYCRL